MRKIKISLIWRVLAACVIGTVCGLFFPRWAVRTFVTFNVVFSQFIGFMVPLIIVGLVTPAIFRIGKSAGKMLLFTVALAYLGTVVAGLFSYSISSSLFPKLIGSATMDLDEVGSNDVPAFFMLEIPPMLNIMSALVFSFITGLVLASVERDALRNVIYDIEDVVTTTVTNVLIPLLPLYIFGIFLKMSFTGEAMPVLKTFSWVIVVIFAMTFLWIVVAFVLGGLIAGKRPFTSLKHMLTAYATALGTSSSAATIPVTLESAKKCGIHPGIAGFSVPLCATINLPGSVIKITACAVTIILMQGETPAPDQFFGFVALLAVTAVAAPGVPGGAIMAALGVLSSVLGFGETEQALMIALYVVMDSFGTACNVTCDGAIAMIVDRFFGKRENPPVE